MWGRHSRRYQTRPRVDAGERLVVDQSVARIKASMQIALHLDHGSNAALHMQIFEQMVAMIRSGKLKPGGPLPSSRELSTQLNVSRNTVSEAYEKLGAEGYIYATRAKGTFVSLVLPEDALST